MPLRTFHGSDGAEWQVWSVIPGVQEGTERRRGYDRRSPDPVIRYTGPEKRVAADRRNQQSLLSPGRRTGWPHIRERE